MALKLKEEPTSEVSDPEMEFEDSQLKAASDGEAETNSTQMEHIAAELELAEWTPDDRLALIESIRSQCPQNDCLSYLTRGKKINWESVSVNKFSPHECLQAWEALHKEIRKYRTLPEVLDDAEHLVQNPQEMKRKRKMHPDQPARPLPPYIRYLMDHRDKYRKKHPEVHPTEVTKILSQRWQSLSPKKQEKYNSQYQEEKKKFLKENRDFLQKHPQVNKSGKKGVHSRPPKSPTPFLCFFEAKFPRSKEKYPHLNITDLKNKLKRKYLKLRPSKKKKWIDMALKSVHDYEVQVEKYLKDHPNYHPPVKKIHLTKEEEIIKKFSNSPNIDEAVSKLLKPVKKTKKTFPGAPEKPPRTAYLLFTKTKIKKMKGSLAEKMVELGRRWQNLGEEKHKHYTEKLAELKEEYARQLEEFEQSLSPEELEAFRDTYKLKKKKKEQGKRSEDV